MSSLQILFLIPILAVGSAAAVHATAYIHGGERRHLPRFWFFFLSTLFSMAAVVLVEGKLQFLLAWEAMGLMSGGLVAFEYREKSVRKAAWIYLIACHAGACALMLSGVLHGRENAFLAAFLCAVAGFGLKIGFPPFHSWLAQAHPVAPAPASAVMSGAMIPLGFYGLMKFFPITLFDASASRLCGWTFLALGAVGALGGILFALPQSNLKKLLAFSSVENMGIVSIGMGLGALECGFNGNTSVSQLCYAGALVHVLNHAFLKGALFLGAGSVFRQTGTLDQDRLGGLLRRMPFTGTLFTVNAMGLAGLPPLNGFLGELALYIGAFTLVKSGNPALVSAGFVAVVALSLSGALAAAAYVKAIYGVFLGLARTKGAEEAVETPKRMYLSQLALTLLSLAMIPFSVWFVDMRTGGFATGSMVLAAAVGLVFAALAFALVAFRRYACPRGAETTRSDVWDCGYEEPTARMAYTPSAFTQPLVDLCRVLLRPRRHLIPFSGDPSAPGDAAFVSETDDIALVGFWRPAFTSVARVFQKIHLLQNGSLHLYILISLLAMLLLFMFALAS